MGNATTKSRESLIEECQSPGLTHKSGTASVGVLQSSNGTNSPWVIRNKVESKFSPLSVVCDQSSQTIESDTAVVANCFDDNVNLRRHVILVFILYILCCVVLSTSTTAQSLLIYLHVIRYPLGDLKDLQNYGLSHARNVQFMTEDGFTLHGYHLVPPSGWKVVMKPPSCWNNSDFDDALASSDRVVIYFHGNGATRAYSNRIEIIKQLATTLDAHVISFDYRGFGDSSGWPTEHGTLLDARAVTKWLLGVITKYNYHSDGYLPNKNSFLANLWGSRKSNESNTTTRPMISAPKLILYGHSLGSAIGTVIAAELNHMSPQAVSALILDCPFSSLVEAIESYPLAVMFRVFPLLKRMMMRGIKFKYETIKVLPTVGAPVMLLHGEHDYKISPLNSHKLLNSAISSGRFIQSEKNLGFCKNVTMESNHIHLVIVPNAGHDNVFRSATWLDHVPLFLDSINKQHCNAFIFQTMLNVRKFSSDWSWPPGNWSDTRSVVFRGVGKRAYLDDCAPLMTVFTMKNLTVQTAKAALIPANLVIAEYNKHVMECEQKEEDLEFDWKTCLERNYVKFQYEAQRMISVSIIKKFLEEFCVAMFSAKIADKLTKNIGKSLSRKWVKHGRKMASQKILFTALWGNCLSYSSLCIYDITFKIWESLLHFFNTWKKKNFKTSLQSVNVTELIKFSGKKVVFFSACWFSSSCGFSLGSFCSEKYGGLIGSLILELVAATTCSTLLCI